MLALLWYAVLLIAGFWLLIKGADVFVEGASSIAGNLHIPKILIGLTIVAFGTSAPEFAVSVKSMLAGTGDIVLGNVIGSNILNILLILGCAALVHPLTIKKNTSKKELPLLLLMTVLTAALLCDHLFDGGAVNTFTRQDGLIIIMFFCIFLYYLFDLAFSKKEKSDGKEEYLSMGKAWLYTLGGIIGIILGSELVVNNATAIATFFHVSDALIALTVVAFGTSLPELVTSITATRKGEYDIAIGNVVGSNLFNIGIVLGLPVALFGDIIATGFYWYDIAALLISAALLFIFGANDRKISKREGITFLAIFVIYYVFVIYKGISG